MEIGETTDHSGRSGRSGTSVANTQVGNRCREGDPDGAAYPQLARERRRLARGTAPLARTAIPIRGGSVAPTFARRVHGIGRCYLNVARWCVAAATPGVALSLGLRP